MPSTAQNVICRDDLPVNQQALRQESGFSLIEMALVLLIMGILTAGGLRVFSSAQDQQAYQQTDHALSQIQEALIGHYLQFGRLPCPDTDAQLAVATDGYEKPTTPTGICVSQRGWLPHLTLGLGGEGDAWGNRYRYVVHPLLTELAESPAQICSESGRLDVNHNIIIRSAENNSKTLAEWVGFAVLSTGKNGRQTNAGVSGVNGAFDTSGGCGQLTIQERENCNADLVLNAGQVLADRQQIQFDDRLVWVSDLQMVASARKAGLCY